MPKNYELLYLLHPDLEGTTDKVMEKVSGFIKNVDGEILSQEDWGKRKLAYKVAKNDFGVYILITFKADPIKVMEIERNLRLSEEVMRSMIITLPEEEKVSRSKRTAKPRREKEETVKAEVVEEKIEKPAKEEAETIKEKEPAKEKAEKPKAKPARDRIEEAKKSVKKVEKPKKESAKDEKARLKKLDEKLEELLK
jgi:small subunit ribosomal protein S6